MTIDQHFTVGKKIDPAIVGPDEFCPATTAPMTVFWKGSDAGSGIANYSLYEGLNGYEPVLLDTTKKKHPTFGNDWDCMTGGNLPLNWKIVAKDRAGNTAEATGSAWDIGVYQEDGHKADGDPYAGSLPVSSTGGWQTDYCVCSDGGSTTYSTQSGDTFTITVGGPSTGSSWLAIVMPKDVDRGEVSMKMDARKPVIVDTYSDGRRDGVIVWQTELKAGTHTITLKNLGTAGRSRIDVDSTLLTPGLEPLG